MPCPEAPVFDLSSASGRYGYHPFNVSASPVKAPIGWFTPKALSSYDVDATIDDFVRCACLAEEVRERVHAYSLPS